MARVLDAAADTLPAIWVGAAGRPAVLRALQTNDDQRLGDFVRELSPASRYKRFHSGFRELSPAWLQMLMRVDPVREFALLALSGGFPSRRIRMIAGWCESCAGSIGHGWLNGRRSTRPRPARTFAAPLLPVCPRLLRDRCAATRFNPQGDLHALCSHSPSR